MCPTKLTFTKVISFKTDTAYNKRAYEALLPKLLIMMAGKACKQTP
jgi:hypothetical protein